MRAFAVLLALLVTAAVAVGTYRLAVLLLRRREQRERAAARWRLRHHSADGRTVVAVSLALPSGEVLDEHVVDRIPDGAPEWSDRFLRARAEAEERAFHLNADRLDGPT